MQQSELDFIQSLRQSSHYIEQHRGKTCVIYLPGDLLQNADALLCLSKDITLLHTLGLKLVLAMGATQQINHALAQQQIQWQQHQQCRITTLEMLPIFQQIIGQVRSQLEAVFCQASNQQNKPLSLVSGNWVIAQPKGVVDGVDFQHTGQLRKINRDAIQACLDSSQIVLLTPLAYSLTGEVFNLNTLEQACAIAEQLQADKLMIFQKPQRYATLPPALNQTQIHGLLPSLEIKTKQLFERIQKLGKSVSRVHLINSADPSSLLLELFTRDGTGCMIFSDRYHQIRPATIEDVGGILEVIAPLEQKGVLVKRSRERLELEIHNFIVIERDRSIIGCAALYANYQNSGELACLAVHSDYRGQELGEQLLQEIEKTARTHGLAQLFLLTTHTHHWFIEHGFKLATPNELPQEKQQLYNYQRNSKVLIKPLKTENKD
ncbi:amino-acid acetyltransferase [Thiosulfatimonas sediminis]|uniref:Amino-acid acetyltransferase n=1 Tax=Thiosulfatimonas sediminis TaxID=2675054 RepID=A0A6F8PWY7_9GAMM|nr:amino-acid N-acetyltransferase [Thiosulfatimonas sediminis]BBP46508.1 amino-acid acetyltransferase [Thiosulfatimonas sediminis]